MANTHSWGRLMVSKLGNGTEIVYSFTTTRGCAGWNARIALFKEHTIANYQCRVGGCIIPFVHRAEAALLWKHETLRNNNPTPRFILVNR